MFIFNIPYKGVSSFSLPGWACLSSAGCASVSPPLSSSPPCCLARLFQTPSSPSLSSSAPAACLLVQLPEKSLSDCDFPADAGEKKQKIGCCCTVRPKARHRCPDLADSWRFGDVEAARLLPQLCQPNKFINKLENLTHTLMLLSHLHHKLVFLQGSGEFSDFLAQAGTTFLSELKQISQLRGILNSQSGIKTVSR